MKTLIMKELREHGLHVALFLLAGLGSVVLLGWFRQLDHEIVLTLLFLFEAPLFTVLLGSHLVQAEVKAGTFPFLASLPMARGRLWAGKLVAALGICGLVYVVFYGLAMLVGAPECLLDFGLGDRPFWAAPWLQTRAVPVLTPGLLLFWFPLVLLAASYWGSVQPAGVPVLETIAAVVGVWLLWSHQILAAMHLPLALAIATTAFLISSWLTFRKGELMTDNWRVGRALATLTAGLAAGVLLWATLDRVADRHLPPWRMEEGIRLTGEGGTGVLFTVRTPAAWYDPLQGLGNKIWNRNDPDQFDHLRCLRFDAGQTEPRQVGRRGLVEPLPAPDGRTMAAVALTRWPGIRSTPRLVMADSQTGEVLSTIDHHARPLQFLGTSGRLLYTRYTPMAEGAVTTELCLHDGIRPPRSLFAAQDEHHLDLGWVYLKCLDSLLVHAPDRDELVLIDTVSGRIASSPFRHLFLQVCQDQSGALLLPAEESAWWHVAPGHPPRRLPEVGSATRFLGKTPDGRWLCVMEVPSADGFGLAGELLGTLDPDGERCQPLERMAHLRLNALFTALSEDGRTLLVSPSSPAPGEAQLIDMESGRPTPVSLPKSSLVSVWPAKGNGFLVVFDQEVWRVTTAPAGATRLAAFPESLWSMSRVPFQ